MSTATLSSPRVAPHAGRAFGGVWRLAIRRYFTPGYWLILAGLLAALALIAISSGPRTGSSSSAYLTWFGGFFICGIVPIFAFVSGAGAARDDLGTATFDYIVTRPVRRPSFVVFRYLAHTACLQIDFVFAFAVNTAVALAHGTPDLWSALPLLFLAQVLAILAFGAIGFLCGMITSRYVIIGLLYGAVIEVGVGNVPTQLNRISLVRQLLDLLRPVLTDSETAVTRVAQTAPLGPVGITALMIFFSVIAVGIAAVLFQRKEFSGAAPAA